MTPKERAVIQQALLYLEAWQNGEEIKLYEIEDTITALREALEQPVSQEPVADDFVGIVTSECVDGVVKWKGWIPREGTKLYTTPQPVRTKDLTDDEIHQAFYSKKTGLINGIRAVIAADREKNK